MKIRTLKLVTHYDAHENEYIIFQHNLTTKEAEEAIRSLSARLYSLFIVDQHGRHVAEDPEACEACRRDVERTSRIHPKPKHKRRKQ